MATTEQGSVVRVPAAGDTTGPAPPAGPPSGPRLEFLDGIRAVAAVYVVLHHIYLVYPGFPDTAAPMWATWLSYGHFAVAVFIVLSGFSLALVPARRDYGMTSGYVDFMKRRFWRIVPPYWIALALSVAVMGLLVSRVRADVLDARGVLTHFLLVQDVVDGKAPNGAFWSIAVEWQLYFLFPLILLARRRVGGLATVATAVIGVAVIGVAADHVGAVGKVLHLSPQMGALFVMGIVAAGGAARRSTVRGREIPWGPVALVLGGIFVVLVATLGTPRVIDDLYWLDLLAGAAMAAALVALARGGGAPVRRLFATRPLVHAGHFSYSLYLIHSPLLIAAWVFVVEPLDISLDGKVLVMILLVTPLVMAASYGFSRCFEQPFQRRRARASAQRADSQPADGPPAVSQPAP